MKRGQAEEEPKPRSAAQADAYLADPTHLPEIWPSMVAIRNHQREAKALLDDLKRKLEA